MNPARVCVAVALALAALPCLAGPTEAPGASAAEPAAIDLTPRLPLNADAPPPAAQVAEGDPLEAPAANPSAAIELQPHAEDAPPDSRGHALLERIVAALAPPGPDADRIDVRRRLSELIRDSSELALVAEDDALRLDAFSLHMQSLHAYVTLFPHDPRVESYLGRLRDTARQTRSLGQPQARPIADFWLLAADLIDLNRAELSIDEQRERIEPLLEKYLDRHPDHPATYAVRQMRRDLRTPPTSEPAPAPSEERDAPVDEAAEAQTPADNPQPTRRPFRVPFELDASPEAE